MPDSQTLNSQESRIRKRKPLRIDLTVENDNKEQKFLKVLAILLDKTEKENENEIEGGDSVDGITDSIASIAGKLSELLECDFDNLSFPKTVIKALKILKVITNFFRNKKT